jgi:hypothetical protein
MQAQIDTHTLSFVAIAKAVKAKLATVDPEMVRWALPANALALPPEVAEASIRRLMEVLDPLHDNSSEATQMSVVRQVGLTIAELGKATANNSGSSDSRDATSRFSLEIISSLLLNLGGSRQLEGEVSARLQQFIHLSCSELESSQPSSETSGAAVLSNSGQHPLRVVFREVDRVLQLQQDEDAVQLLMGTLPDLPRAVAELHQERVAALLLRWRAKVHALVENVTAQRMGDEAVMLAMGASVNDLLNIIAFLLNGQPMEIVLACAQEWITSFFENATGQRTHINVERVLAVLRTGHQHQLHQAATGNEGRNIFAATLDGTVTADSPPAPPVLSAEEVLQSLGVDVSVIPQAAHEPLLMALDVTGNTEEMFTCEPLVQDGRVAAGLACIIKHANRGGGGGGGVGVSTHVFVYDADSLREWVAQSNTVPETREDVDARTTIIDIS